MSFCSFSSFIFFSTQTVQSVRQDWVYQSCTFIVNLFSSILWFSYKWNNSLLFHFRWSIIIEIKFIFVCWSYIVQLYWIHLSSFDSFLVNSFSSVQSFSRVRLFATLWTTACQASLSITNSQSSPNPCPLSQWCYPTISSSVVPFSSCPQSFPATGSFPVSQLFPSGGQRIGVSASKPVLPMNTQDWSPLGWTGWISLQSKGFSRVFSNTIVQKSTQLSL